MENRIQGVTESLIKEYAKSTKDNCPQYGIQQWLTDELIKARKQVKKLNIDDVSKPFYCNDANIDEAAENYPVKVCKEQCSECKNVC